jgi:uncharacterized membrane protein YdbT with pleckstrin-like domain
MNTTQSNTQEQIIWEGSQSQVLNIGTYIAMIIISIIVLTLSLMFFPIAAVLVVIPLVYMMVRWLLIRSNRYKVTTERVFFTTGIFSKKTEALELYRVRDIDMYEPFWQRMFKLGNVKLTTSDKTTPDFLLKAVPHPAELLNSIRKAVETRRDVKRVRGVEFLDDNNLNDENIENT